MAELQYMTQTIFYVLNKRTKINKNNYVAYPPINLCARQTWSSRLYWTDRRTHTCVCTHTHTHTHTHTLSPKPVLRNQTMCNSQVHTNFQSSETVWYTTPAPKCNLFINLCYTTGTWTLYIILAMQSKPQVLHCWDCKFEPNEGIVVVFCICYVLRR
jgi:hypothetical protein